jgi:hypothetical protein
VFESLVLDVAVPFRPSPFAAAAGAEPSDLIRRQAVVFRKDHAQSKNFKRDRGSIGNDRGFSAIRKMKTGLPENSCSAETVMVGFYRLLSNTTFRCIGK